MVDKKVGDNLRYSDLPFGSEFSPSQIELPRVLELAQEHGGDWKVFEESVRKDYFDGHSTNDYNKGKLADNTKLGMIAYGLIDREAKLTPFGFRLYQIRHNEEKLYRELARHILLNLHGLTLVQCVQDVQAAGETVNLVKLREWLEERGVHFPRGGRHVSTMRLWLEKAGVFKNIWEINDAKLKELIGTSMEEIELLAQLSPRQQAYLKTIINIGSTGPYYSNEVEKLAAATYGIKFDEKNLPKSVLYPLQEAGYITLERGTKEKGRGAKPFLVRSTEKLYREVLFILEQLERQTGVDFRRLLRKPFSVILKELRSSNKHTRGMALEELAFKLIRLLDLTYVATRLRGSETGGAEVDLIFETSRLVFSRWQVQCKNTKRVVLDDIAKEVGLTHFIKSNVIVMVSTGEIGQQARRYANKIMKDSNLCIVMVNRADIQTIERNPVAIVDVFNREAKSAMKLKALEI